MYAFMYLCMCSCMYVSVGHLHVSHVCMYVSVCMYVCMYVCVYVHTSCLAIGIDAIELLTVCWTFAFFEAAFF
jgi:hypothetical protein